MRKIGVFNFVTINGFYKGLHEEINWHKHGEEEAEFSAESMSVGGTLLFGRVTFEMMASFWPTPMAMEQFPIVAEGMTKAEKIVFSTTLKKSDWDNTKIVKDNMIEELKKMKQMPGKDMTVLGSGSIVTQLADHGLIDEYQIMIDPVAIGEGIPLFKGLQCKLELTLTKTKVFKSGVVLLCYRPS
jgi:dihydrofolate reductase